MIPETRFEKIRTLWADPPLWGVCVFAATFTFALLALREADAVGGGTVPGPTVLVTYVLMLASVATLLVRIDHAGNAVRAAGLIDLVGDRLRSWNASTRRAGRNRCLATSCPRASRDS
jgi:uncharacterized membrane protein